MVSFFKDRVKILELLPTNGLGCGIKSREKSAELRGGLRSNKQTGKHVSLPNNKVGLKILT